MSSDQSQTVEDLKKLEGELVERLKGSPSNRLDLLVKLAEIRLVLNSDLFTETIRKIFSTDSKFPPAIYLHGKWFEKKSQIARAIKCYSEVMDICSGRGDLYDKSVVRRAECNFLQGYFQYARSFWCEFKIFRSPKYKVRSIVSLLFFHLFVDGDLDRVEELLSQETRIRNELIINVMVIYYNIIRKSIDLPAVTKGLQEIQKLTSKEESKEYSPLIHYVKSQLFLSSQTKENILLALKELEDGMMKNEEKKIFRRVTYLEGLRFRILGKLGRYSYLHEEFPRQSELVGKKDMYCYNQLRLYELQCLHMEFRSTMEYEKMKKLFSVCEEILDEEELQMVSPQILLEISDVYRRKSSKWVIGYELVRRALLILPSCVEIQAMLGWYTYYYLRETEKSVSILHEAIEKSPNRWKASLFLAELFFREKLYDESIDHFKSALEKENVAMTNMDKFRIGLKVAKCYQYLGKQEEQFELLDQLLLEVGTNRVPKTQHMFIAEVNALDRSYSVSLENLERIENTDVLDHEEVREYYNLMVEIIRRKRKKKPLLEFYDKYLSTEASRSCVAEEVQKYLSVKSSCLIASSLIEIGKVEEGRRIFNNVHFTLTKYLERLYKQQEKEKKGEDEDEGDDIEPSIGSLKAKIERVQWNFLRFLILRSRSYFENNKYEASLKELMVARDFLKTKLVLKKRRRKKKKKKKLDDEESEGEEEEEKMDGEDSSNEPLFIPFHQKMVIMQLMFQRGLIFEKLGVPKKAVGEYTNILLSFFEDKIELEKLNGEEKPIEHIRKEVQIIGKKRHDYFITALDHRIHCYIELKQHDKAVNDLNLLYHPDDPRTHIHSGLLGRIYEALSLWGPSLKFYTESIRHVNTKELRENLVKTDRRSLYDDLYTNTVGFITEKAILERYIDSLFSRGRIFFRMRNYVRSIDDMKIVLEHCTQKPEQYTDKLKETYHCLGYSHIHLNNGEGAANVFRDMIKQFPDDDRGFLARSRAHFVGGVNLRKSLEDLLSACRLNTEENREEKKSLLQSYLKAVRRLFNMQIEAEFTLSKKLFMEYKAKASSVEESFKIIFDDEDLPVPERCVYIHPLFTFVSPYIRREYINRGVREILVGTRMKDDPKLWESYQVVRDWMMCLGILEGMKEKLLEDVIFLEKVYFLARSFELKGLMCYLVREFNPFILQDYHQKKSGSTEEFKKQILTLSLRLLEKEETDSMLFLNCLGFFRYLINVDERRTKLEAFRNRNSPDRTKSAPLSMTMRKQLHQQQQQQQQPHQQMTKSFNQEDAVGECDFLFEKGKLDEKDENLRVLLVEMVKQKDLRSKGMSLSLTPIDYLRQLLDRHPNFLKRKSDSQPSTIYERLLELVWSNQESYRNLWIKDQEGKVMKVHIEILLTKMSYFRETFKKEDMLGEEGYERDGEGGQKYKMIEMKDVPNSILLLMMGFCYKERDTVRNFDITSWGKEEFDLLLSLVKKYSMKRFEIVLMLKFLKELTKDW